MSCLIVLQDGRACAPAPWAFDAILEAVADQLAADEGGVLLADWLRQQSREAQEVGAGRIDVRELTPQSRELFLEAVRRAATGDGDSAAPRGSESIAAGWQKRLRRMARMLHSIDAGEPPEAVSDTPCPVAPTGLRRGPGWRCAS